MKNIFPFALLFPIMLFAQSVWNGTVDVNSWYTGNESANAYTITTAEQLAGLAQLVNNGKTFSGKTITLGANIALNDTNAQGGWRKWNESNAPANKWTPIGNAANNFKGKFDGNGKVVSGLYINSTADYQGLFGVAYEGNISSFGLAGFYVKGGKHIGSMVGRLNVMPVLSCTELLSVAYLGSAINTPKVACSVGSLTNLNLTNAPSWNNLSIGTYNVTATGTCDGITGLTANCGTLIVTCTANNNNDTQYCIDGVMKSYDTFIDTRDSKTYKTVVIGTQTWMAENLNYNNGSKCYGNADSNCVKYGRLYDWATAMNISMTYNNSIYTASAKHKGVCPTGWHLPSYEEWAELANYAGGISTAGTKLKTASGWNSSGNGTDNYGFSALPGGYVSTSSSFFNVGNNGYWWSTEEASGSSSSYCWAMGYDRGTMGKSSAYKSILYSVRCLKN